MLALDDLLTSGRFADIFRPAPGQQVIKLFRKKPLDPDGRAVRAICQAEQAAYRLGSADPELASHIPQFFGTVRVEDVVDPSGASRADRYWLECCYALEFLPGPLRKVWDTPDEYHKRLEALLDRFCQAGIQYPADADVWNWEDPVGCKLVDMALQDAAADHAHLLYDQHGSLVQ